MMKKAFKLIHLWLSVPFGLIVTLICLSGAILIFERDFGHIGQSRIVSNGLKPIPLDSILQSADDYLAGKNKIIGVTTYPDSEHAYKVMLANPAMAAIWVNQYSGEVMGKYERAEIFKLASSAHRRLFGKSKADGAIGAKSGKLIIGITTVSLLFIIISGLIVWWPTKGSIKKKFIVSTDKGAYRFWFDFHCVGGVICSVVLILCILTGLNWSFGWYRTAIYTSLGTKTAKSSSHKTPAEYFTAWKTAYDGIKGVNPNSEIRMYQGEVDVVEKGFGNQQAYTTYRFDNETGRITDIIPYAEKDKADHIKGWIYTIHVGSWGGWITKILYLICVIIGASLPISSYYLWIRRLIRKRHG